MYDFHGMRHSGAGLNLAPMLSNTVEHSNTSNGSFYITGNLKNLKLTLTETNVFIKGSLCKWFLGDNLQTLTRSLTQRAIEKLSDDLHFKVNCSRVTRLDFAQNFFMASEVKEYQELLGELQYYDRSMKRHSLYYESGNRTLVFYDKRRELAASGFKLPKELANHNILRYEMRIEQRLAKLMNMSIVTVSDTYEESFYIQVFDMWLREFKRIKKIRKMTTEKIGEITPQDVYDFAAFLGIEALGGETAFYKQIDNWRKEGRFKIPEYSSRSKKMIREKFNNSQFSEKCDLIEELEQKIERAGKYYR